MSVMSDLDIERQLRDDINKRATRRDTIHGLIGSVVALVAIATIITALLFAPELMGMI